MVKRSRLVVKGLSALLLVGLTGCGSSQEILSQAGFAKP
jgi:hypothetical protein